MSDLAGKFTYKAPVHADISRLTKDTFGHIALPENTRTHTPVSPAVAGVQPPSLFFRSFCSI